MSGTGILAAIIVIGILVTVHELGHFMTAKWTGMRVDEFAIGFGPKLWHKQKGETLYSVRAIPLGGFNRIAGMEPDLPEPGDYKKIVSDGRGFRDKSIPARMLVIVAGALMNFLLPVILYAGLSFCTGVDEMVNEPVLGEVHQNMVAYQAGLRSGDRLLTLNGVKLVTWYDVVDTVRDNGEKPMQIALERNGQVLNYTVIPAMNQELGRAVIGISPSFRWKECGFFESIGIGAKRVVATAFYMLHGLYQILTGRAPADLAGPIGVAMVAGDVAAKGVEAILNFICFLSINLGIINLLPLPALDGGHFALLILEGLRGKPLPDKAMEYIQYVGVAMILAIMLFSTYKDLLRF